MKKIIVVFNPEKKLAVKEQKKLTNWLLKKNLEVVSFPSTAVKFPKAEICISLGGDGTILKLSRKIAPMNVPVLGINLGSLGFLAETDLKDMYRVVEKILAGKYTIDDRIMLDVELKKKNRSVCLVGLNDCIVRCGASSRVILLRLKINNEFLAEYLGDGIIISTPTGSTAYSLATGGPIVHPQLSVFIISPVCPHTLSQRPLIVSSDSELTIEIPEYKSNKEIIVSVDGQENFVVSSSDRISIKKSKYTLKLITHPEKTYYRILREKLRWGL